MKRNEIVNEVAKITAKTGEKILIGTPDLYPVHIHYFYSQFVKVACLCDSFDETMNLPLCYLPSGKLEVITMMLHQIENQVEELVTLYSSTLRVIYKNHDNADSNMLDTISDFIDWILEWIDNYYLTIDHEIAFREGGNEA